MQREKTSRCVKVIMHLETIDAAARFEVSSNEFASLASGLSTDRHHGELPSIHLELCLDRASRKRIEMHLHPQRYPILFQLGFPENKGSSRCSTSNSILGSSWAGLSESSGPSWLSGHWISGESTLKHSSLRSCGLHGDESMCAMDVIVTKKHLLFSGALN